MFSFCGVPLLPDYGFYSLVFCIVFFAAIIFGLSGYVKHHILCLSMSVYLTALYYDYQYWLQKKLITEDQLNLVASEIKQHNLDISFLRDLLGIKETTSQLNFFPCVQKFAYSIVYSNYGLLIVLAISSVLVYLLILGGWASNAKYSFLEALRSSAQMISYEVYISLVLLPVVLLAGTLNFVEIGFRQFETGWYIMLLLPCSIIFLISILAETNRAPFDLIPIKQIK